jgi:hypothetical protein
MTAPSRSTTDLLLHMIVALLTPMFLTTTGNVNHAYAAAQATVRSCTARNPMDLLLIGQMIAFGLATLSSVSLSMEDNIPINLILRLRGNAVSLHRASDKCRRALPEPEPNPAVAHDAPLTGAELHHETEIIAEVELTRKRVAEYQAGFAQPQATPATVSNLPPDAGDKMKAATAQTDTESERRTGKPAAAPTGTPFSPESNLRAACTLAFPDATPAEIDTMVKEAMAESGAESMHAAAPHPTASNLIKATSAPPGWSRTPSDFPDTRDAA